jgi:glycerol-3-phosphate dehydrogenase (NAD(P)+)
VKSCLAIRDLAQANGVEVPITEQVEKVCHENLSPRVALKTLMSRETKPE